MLLAFYLRLSCADGDLGADQKDESNSIDNQRLLLQSFVNSRDDLFGDILEYIDDGYTGTNFDRPGFKRMVEDAKAGKVSVILVKDLSRLGRDYIGVGDYLEQVFPVLGVRFIAVNSNYDSDNYIGRTVGLEMGITNLVNTLYSRDLSKKVKSAKETKWKQGLSTIGRIPFGYKKDPENKGKWVIDPVAGAYVRLIFEKALSRWSSKMIADYLNEHKIPTPGQYREQNHDGGAYFRKVTDEEWLWNTAAVWRILKRYSYTGAMVQGMTRNVSVGVRNRRNTDPSEWSVVDGVNEAIVTKEEFLEAQRALGFRGKYGIRQDRGFSLRGKVRCGNCNLLMAYHETNPPIIKCEHATGTGRASKCCRQSYAVGMIEHMVLFSLRNQLNLLDQLACRISEEKSKVSINLETERRKAEKELEILEAEKIRQYESYADGLITKEVYLGKKASLNEKIDATRITYEKMCSVTREKDELLSEVGNLQSRANEMPIFEKMTREIAEAFIDTVYIYNKDHVEIVFTFDDLLQRAERCLEKDEREATV